MVVLHVIPSAGRPALQRPDPALQGTTSPVLTQTLLGCQEWAHTAMHPWCQGKTPFPASFTVVFGHTNDSCALQLPVLVHSKEAARGPLLGCLG